MSVLNLVLGNFTGCPSSCTVKNSEWLSFAQTIKVFRDPQFLLTKHKMLTLWRVKTALYYTATILYYFLYLLYIYNFYIMDCVHICLKIKKKKILVKTSTVVSSVSCSSYKSWYGGSPGQWMVPQGVVKWLFQGIPPDCPQHLRRDHLQPGLPSPHHTFRASTTVVPVLWKPERTQWSLESWLHCANLPVTSHHSRKVWRFSSSMSPSPPTVFLSAERPFSALQGKDEGVWLQLHAKQYWFSWPPF